MSGLGALGGVRAKCRLLTGWRTDGIDHLDGGGIREELTEFSQ